jgi:mRNA interferase MazF
MKSSLQFGQVVRIRQFPFTDQEGTKTAPAVVLSLPEYHQSCGDVIVARITSQLRNQERFGSVDIRDFEACGLSRPSVIKPVIMTVLQVQVAEILGELDDRTVSDLKLAYREVLGVVA